MNSVDLDGSQKKIFEGFTSSKVSIAAGASRSDAAKSTLPAKDESNGKDSKKLSIVLGKEMHRRAKMQALKEDVTLKQLVVSLLEKHLNDQCSL